MSTEITLLYSGVIVSEASSESVQWPKFIYIYVFIYIYIILAYIFCGETNVIGSMKLCNTKPPM